MISSASPYVIFRAEDLVTTVAQPIGIGKCIRLAPKKNTLIKSSLKKKSRNSLKKVLSKKHVQLAFA